MKKAEEKEKSEYTHVIKYTGLFGGVQGITLLASLIRNKLVAVLPGPSGVGLISMYNTLVTLLNNATNLGISFSAVRNVSQISEEGDREALRQYVSVVPSWSMLTAVCGTLLCFALSPQISYWTFGIACILVSASLSLYLLNKTTTLLKSILQKFGDER